MSTTSQQDTFKFSRPPGSRGRIDRYLVRTANELRRAIVKAQTRHRHSACHLSGEQIDQIAIVMAEFAEDIHCGVGLWSALETYQEEFFGTPLPFLVDPDDAVELEPFDPRRVQFLLWSLLPTFQRDYMVSPRHQDLKTTAQAISAALIEGFPKLPRDSGIKHFLAGENRHAGDVKVKLVWLGMRSYLFRHFYSDYCFRNDLAPHEIGVIDDFICQICTPWAGLGVIDVLAEVLKLEGGDRTDLRSWYERHSGFFRIVEERREGSRVQSICVRNCANGENYEIWMDCETDKFRPGELIHGALTPWRGRWYWSGEQKSLGDAPAATDRELRQTMLQKSCHIAYRYCHEEAEKARGFARDNHAQFLEYYGDDLVTFPSGLDMAASEQKRMEAIWAQRYTAEARKTMKKLGYTKPRPNLNYPDEILNHERGVGLFSDPREGIAFYLGFDVVQSAVQTRGQDMTEDEADALQQLLENEAMAPSFIRRLIAGHGAESFASAFALQNQPVNLALEFLLRRHKGKYFRNRYPNIALLE